MLNNELDLSFNYEPITYGEIKSGIGKGVKGKQTQEMLDLALPSDRTIGDVLQRTVGKYSCYTDMIVWEDAMLPTIKSNCSIFRGTEKTYISKEDVISAQTFPVDYDFGNNSYHTIGYICGMSVPPPDDKTYRNKAHRERLV